MSLRIVSGFIFVIALTRLCNADTLTEIGGLPGYNWSQARAVSDNGTVVGNMITQSTGAMRPFRWQNGVLGFVSTQSPFGFQAYGVSGDGSVTVGQGEGPSNPQPMRWVNGVGQGLGYMDALQRRADARGVSADGAIVAGNGHDQFGNMAGFRWQNGVMTNIGNLPDGGPTVVNGLSADGSTIVGRSGLSVAFRWKNGVMSGLGALPGLTFSEAYGVSGDGSVVAGLFKKADGLMGHPFVWKDGVMSAIDNLPDMNQGYATGVSGDGSTVVGFEENDSGFLKGFVWDNTHGVRDLKQMMIDAGINVTGWGGFLPWGISPNGMYIVGESQAPDRAQAGWVLAIPEPASLSMLLLGVLALSRRR